MTRKDSDDRGIEEKGRQTVETTMGPGTPGLKGDINERSPNEQEQRTRRRREEEEEEGERENKKQELPAGERREQVSWSSGDGSTHLIKRRRRLTHKLTERRPRSKKGQEQKRTVIAVPHRTGRSKVKAKAREDIFWCVLIGV